MPTRTFRLPARRAGARRRADVRRPGARRRAGAEDRGRRRRHVDRSALLQPVPEQQHRRAHLRQARADGPRLADDPGHRDVVEGDRRHDLGVQAAQGRQVPRRQRAHRRGRRVLDRPRRRRSRTARARSSAYTKAIVGEGDRRPVHDPLQDGRAVSADRRTTCRRSTSCRRRSRPARRPRTSTPARRRSAAAATSSCAT